MALLYAFKLSERYHGGIKALGDHMQGVVSSAERTHRVRTEPGIWDIESTPKPRGQRDPVAPSMTGIKSTPAPGLNNSANNSRKGDRDFNGAITEAADRDAELSR